MNILNKHINKRGIYAVHMGQYEGEMWVFIKSIDDTYQFLALPTMVNRHCDKKNWILGINNNIVKYVRKIPKDIWKTCQSQFEYNSYNRREQSSPPSILDFEQQGIRPKRFLTSHSHTVEVPKNGIRDVQTIEDSHDVG